MWPAAEECDGGRAVAEQEPVEDRPGADVGAHDARVPGEAPEHDEADRHDHVAQQRDAIDGREDGGGQRRDGEGDGEVAAVEHHDEGERHGGGHAGGKGADGEMRSGCLVAGDFFEAVGDHIEERCEHDGEQRKRYRAVELRHAQIGQHERQQGRHDGGKRIQARGADRQRASAPQPQDSHSSDGESRKRREGQELRYVLGQPQHAVQGGREQLRIGRRLEARPGGDRSERDDASQRRGRSRGRAAPGGDGEDRHGDDGEHCPPRIHARGARAPGRQAPSGRQARRRRSSRARRHRRGRPDAARSP